MAGSMEGNRVFRWATFVYVGIGVVFGVLVIASLVTRAVT